MPKSLLSSLVAILLTLYLANDAVAVKHTVSVQNYSFTPANLNVQVGDTIRWVWVNGFHTTTSTTIPAGAATWDEPINSSNTFYEYRVTVAGVYDYLCTPHSSTQIGHFTATAPVATLSVTPSNQNVLASAGSTNFTVTSNSNWTAVSNAGWCSVTSSGSGNGAIIANYQTNTLTTQRVATITVSVAGLPNVTVTVTQAGAEPTLTVTPSNVDVTSSAGIATFTVTSNSTWTVSSDAPWCVLEIEWFATDIFYANYEANTSPETRVANITVTVEGLPDEVVTVTQEGFSAMLMVSPANRNVSAQAGTTSFSISSNLDWTTATNASWISVPSAGTGNATLNVGYEANEELEQRVATISVSAAGVPTAIVTVTQAGAAVVLSVDPLNQDVTAQAGTTTFNITCNANWSVTSPESWVSATADGSGSGIIVVDYEENTSSEVRVATLTVGASDLMQQITVTQEGAVSVVDNTMEGISVYPNPSTGLLYFTAGQSGGDAQLKIIDTKGNVMMDRTISNHSSFAIDAFAIGRGTYLLRLDQKGKAYVTKIVLLD